MLRVLTSLPDGLLTAGPRELHKLLGGPTLIHLPGRHARPLFASVLLHGNETAGFEAAQSVLRKYAPGGGNRPLPRSLSLFIGNVAAAEKGLRRLEDQPDFNRIWPGAESGGTPEHAVMAQVLAEMQARNVFASIDLHQNTGINPHYGCVNRLQPAYLHLARLFSRTVVYFRKPKGVQSMAFGEICPAVTLECGRVGETPGVAHAAEFFDACLHLTEFPERAPEPRDIDLLHTVAIVKVPRETSFSFEDEAVDLRFVEGLDRLNFTELPVGSVLAFRGSDVAAGLEVFNEQGSDVTGEYFDQANGVIRTRVALTPSMLTRDATIIRQDCFCYLMERVPFEQTRAYRELQTAPLAVLQD